MVEMLNPNVGYNLSYVNTVSKLVSDLPKGISCSICMTRQREREREGEGEGQEGEGEREREKKRERVDKMGRKQCCAGFKSFAHKFALNITMIG